MKCVKLKNPIALFALAIVGFTACKKDVALQPDAIVPTTDEVTIDSASQAATKMTTNATATYYISPSGNDATGSGAVGSPWKTLYKATSVVSSSGAVIHVNAGTYTETATCALKPGVSIEGDGVTSIIKSTVTEDWKALLTLSSAEGTNGNQHLSKLKFDGNNLSTFYGIIVSGRKNVSIHDVTIANFKETGVYFAGRADNLGQAPTIYATGNSFYNNTVLNCSRFEGYGRGNLQMGGQDGLLIYNNTITQNQRAAGNNGYCIKYINEGYNKGCKIYGNTLTRAQSTGGDFDFCIELFRTSGLEVYNNTFNGGALDLNYQTKGSYTYSIWAHNNQFLQPAVNTVGHQDGIILEFGTDGAIIENNVFSKQNFGIFFTPRDNDEVKNIVIRKNLFKDNGSGIWGGYYISFGNTGNGYKMSNIDIYNNTMEYDRSKPFWFGINLPNANGGTFSNINIKNNIISGCMAAAISQSGSTSISNLVIQNNNFYGNVNNGMSFNGPAAGAGYVFSNNKTVTAAYGTNYALPAGSPLIDAGINIGLVFNGAAPDMGYAEY